MNAVWSRAARLTTLGRRRQAAVWFALDVLLAGGLLALDLPRVWVTYPGDHTMQWSASGVAVGLVLVQTLPIAVRRLFPLPVLVTTVTGVLAYSALTNQPEPDYLAVCVAVYTVAAEVPHRISRWFLGATVVLLPAALAQDLTLIGIFRAVVLLTLVWTLGLDRRRSIRDRERVVQQEAQQAAREQALGAARRSVAQREQLARSLHDGLARSLTIMTVHGEALKASAGAGADKPLDGMLRAGREALTVLQATVAALDHGTPPARPTGWTELLAGFRDCGLHIEVADALDDIPLDDERGRCLYRVIHEALTNALRHAGPACTVRIDVDRRDTTIAAGITNTTDGYFARHPMCGGGFGLASIERDVAALSGRVEYGATPGGWRVWVSLPAVPAHLSRPARTAAIPVIVVDDEDIVRNGIRLLLDVNPDIEVVADLADASALFDHLRPGAYGIDSPEATDSGAPGCPGAGDVVVLLDLIMPDTDTMAVLAKLRQPPYAPRVRVLILTTIGSDTAVRRCMAAGAHGFLVKGSTAHQLATAVRAVADGLVAVGAGAATPDGVPPGSAPPASNGRPSVDRRLTPRETEVLQLLGEGLSNREIANRLRLSERTIKIHVSAVLGKLGVQSRTQAALAARTRIGGDG